jgi:hypothetical protein
VCLALCKLIIYDRLREVPVSDRLHPRFVLRFPKHTPRLCDDCALLLDHVNDVDAIAPEPPIL